MKNWTVFKGGFVQKKPYLPWLVSGEVEENIRNDNNSLLFQKPGIAKECEVEGCNYVALDDGKMNVHLELTHGVGWMTGITKPMEVDEKVWVPFVNDNKSLDEPETAQKPAAPVNKILDNSGMADKQKVRD